MTEFWSMTSSLADEAEYGFLLQNPPALHIANLTQLNGPSMAAVTPCNAYGARLPRRCPLPGLPPAVLVFPSEKVAPNFLDLGFYFVSARLRRALQAVSGDVEYLPVDASQCPPNIQVLDYRVMHVALYDNPIDMLRTEGSVIEMGPFDGPQTQVWVPYTLDRSKPAGPMVWRDDFIAPGPMFAVPGQRWIMVAEDVADRVTRAGITDVMFFDPFASRSAGQLVVRR